MRAGRFKARLPVIAVVLFALAGGSVSTLLQVSREREAERREIRRMGGLLSSVVAHYPLADADPGARRLFLKSVVEQASREGLAYLVVHDRAEKILVHLGPESLTELVPDSIRLASLRSGAPGSHSFTIKGSPGVYHEFAAPWIDSNDRGGTVRLGFRRAPVEALSPAHLAVGAKVALLMIGAALIAYYAMVLALKGLRTLQEPDAADPATPTGFAPVSVERDGIIASLSRLDEQIAALKQQRTELADVNTRQASRLGAAAFERQRALHILDSLDFGIATIDGEDRVRYANRYLCNLLDRPLDDMIGKSIADALSNETLLRFLQRQDPKVTDPLGTVSEIEISGLTPNQVFLAKCGVFHDDDVAGVGKLLSVHNITHSKQVETIQEEFVARVAHELLTPLTSLKSYSDILMSGAVTDGETQKEFYNTINQETDRLTLLVKNLLNASKMDLGSMQIEKSLVRTDWLMEHCLPAVQATAKEKNISLQTHMPDRYPTLTGDKELLQVVVVNILGNAVKYTPEGGEVSVTLSEKAGSVHVEIADTGHGIAEEDLPHIYEKFYRGGDPNTRAESGSGLGLSTAYQIVKLHGGTINVESEVGKGTCFIIQVPLGSQTYERDEESGSRRGHGAHPATA